MATLILTAVGTAIGGPIGGAIGAFVGQQADHAIFGAGSREGPRLKELAVTTSSYGQSLPRVFGRMRVAGTIIWSTEIKESSSKEGGGKGRPSTKTYAYSVSFAVALSSTPIDRIGRIWADGNLLRGANGDLKTGGTLRVYSGTGDNQVDPLISADKGGNAPAFRDCSYAVFEDLQLGDFGNRIPALTFEVFAENDDTVALDQLVPGLSNPEASTIQHARGYADEGGPIGSSIDAIDKVIPLTCVTSGDGLTISPVGFSIDQIPLLSSQLSEPEGEPGEQRNNHRAVELGKEPLALRYYDEGRDYQPSVQRSLGLRPEGRETVVDLPATMTSDGARELANANAHRARWRNEKRIWRTAELNPEIGPGTVVNLPSANGLWLVRSWEWFDRGIELTLERYAPQLGEAPTSDGGSANTTEDLIATPTLLSVFELPPGDAADIATPAIYVAASSQGAGWRDAALFAERADTLVGLNAKAKQRAVSGNLATALVPSSCTTFQPNDRIEVELHSDDLAFENTDLTGIAMGANRLLVGGEILQFLAAAQLSPSRWSLSGLLRGRAGTEDVASFSHSAGTSVVLLDERLEAIDSSQGQFGLGSRVAAIGRGDNGPVFAEVQNIGLSLRPPMPVLPNQCQLSDGTLKWSWTRRARGHWRWPEAAEVPLVEEQELYTVGLGPSEAPLASWSVAVPAFELSSSESAELLSLYGANPLWVRQIGTFGRSSPLSLGSIN